MRPYEKVDTSWKQQKIDFFLYKTNFSEYFALLFFKIKFALMEDL